MEEELITIPEAAHRSGMSETGLRSAMKRGKLPFKDFYGRKMLNPADVDTYRATVKIGRPSKKEQTQ